MRRRSPGGVAASRLTASGITGKETVENSLKKETAAAGKTERGGGRLGGRAATGSAVKLQQRGQRRRADQGYGSNPRGGIPLLSLLHEEVTSRFFSSQFHSKKPTILSSPLPLNRREKERGLP